MAHFSELPVRLSRGGSGHHGRSLELARATRNKRSQKGASERPTERTNLDVNYGAASGPRGRRKGRRRFLPPSSAAAAAKKRTLVVESDGGKSICLASWAASYSQLTQRTSPRVFERAPRRAIATANLSPLCFLPFRSDPKTLPTNHPTDPRRSKLHDGR